MLAKRLVTDPLHQQERLFGVRVAFGCVRAAVMGFDRPDRGIFRLLRHVRIILDRLYLLVLADRWFRGIAFIFTAAAGNKWQQAE